MSEEIKGLIQKQGDIFAEYKKEMAANLDALKKDQTAGLGEATGKITAMLADYDQFKAKVDKVAADMEAAKLVGSKEDPKEIHNKAVKDAFSYFARKGDATKYQALVQVGVDADGGYACPPELSSRIASLAAVANPIRQLATVESISRNAWQMLNDPNQMVATRIGETGTRAETATPEIGMTEIVAREMYCYPWATQQVLDDAVWDFEAWLANHAGRAFNNLEVTEFANGDGVAGARGIANYPTVLNANWAWGSIGHVLTGTSSAISDTAADIVNVMGILDDEYKSNASWVMNPATLTSYRLLRDADAGANVFLLWSPSLVAGTPDTLSGYPVYTTTGMPIQASDANIVLFGDIREAYTIVDRVGVNIIRDNITTPGRVKFHTYKRMGAAVTNFQAVKMIRCTT